MYTQTLAKSITEARHKLIALKQHDLVVSCTLNSLTHAQTEAFADHTEKSCYYDEDKTLALENLFRSLANDHIYVLEMCDGEDDKPRYYYTDIAPQIHLCQDADGGLVRI